MYLNKAWSRRRITLQEELTYFMTKNNNNLLFVILNIKSFAIF